MGGLHERYSFLRFFRRISVLAFVVETLGKQAAPGAAMAACAGKSVAGVLDSGVPQRPIVIPSRPGFANFLNRSRLGRGARIGVKNGARLQPGLGKSKRLRAQVILEEANKVEQDEEGRLWSPTPAATAEWEKKVLLDSENGLTTNDSAAKSTNGAAVGTNGAGTSNESVSSNGGVSTNGTVNGSSQLPRNGAARATVDAIKGVQGKVDIIGQEDPWFKKAASPNVKVCHHCPFTLSP